VIVIIAAMDKKKLIGNKGKLPWNFPADLKRFKELTTGNTVVMGRKTFESIGKPLPNRNNIVLSKDPDYHAQGCFNFMSVDSVIRYYKAHQSQLGHLYVIGGSEIYNQFIPHADTMQITEIDRIFRGDTHFPKIDWSEWEVTEKVEILKDATNAYKSSFVGYRKVRKST
jgi:dihydrofolate reductase